MLHGFYQKHIKHIKISPVAADLKSREVVFFILYELEFRTRSLTVIIARYSHRNSETVQDTYIATAK